MNNGVEEIDGDESEDRLERVAAIDVAKAQAMSARGTPHPSGSGRR